MAAEHEKDDFSAEGRVWRIIADGMEKKGMSILQLAQNLHMTYEMARRIVRGQAIPSTQITKHLAKVLSVDYSTLHQAANAERVRTKYRVEIAEIAKQNPELAELEADWATLRPEQKEFFRGQIALTANANRKQRRSRAS